MRRNRRDASVLMTIRITLKPIYVSGRDADVVPNPVKGGKTEAAIGKRFGRPYVADRSTIALSSAALRPYLCVPTRSRGRRRWPSVAEGRAERVRSAPRHSSRSASATS